MGHDFALAERVLCCWIRAINITGIAVQVDPVVCAPSGVNCRCVTGIKRAAFDGRQRKRWLSKWKSDE